MKGDAVKSELINCLSNRCRQMNPPSIRVDEVVLHSVGDERFASLSEQKEADTEMGLDLRHPHNNMGHERPTTLFKQKVNNTNMETQLVFHIVFFLILNQCNKGDTKPNISLLAVSYILEMVKKTLL